MSAISYLKQVNLGEEFIFKCVSPVEISPRHSHSPTPSFPRKQESRVSNITPSQTQPNNFLCHSKRLLPPVIPNGVRNQKSQSAKHTNFSNHPSAPSRHQTAKHRTPTLSATQFLISNSQFLIGESPFPLWGKVRMGAKTLAHRRLNRTNAIFSILRRALTYFGGWRYNS